MVRRPESPAFARRSRLHMSLKLCDNRADAYVDTTREDAMHSLIIGGLLLDVIAISLMSSSQPRLLDAINIYNDGVSGP